MFRRALAAAMVLAFALTAGPVDAQAPPQAYVIKIDGMINQAFAEAVQRKIDFARERGVRTVILELDTGGGTVVDSQDLADYIFTLDDTEVIAYIHPKAYSGGTMVALACKEIYIDADLGAMGDAAPIGPTGEIVGEKFQSPLRKKMVTYARARGYPTALVEAMVTKELEVFRQQMRDDPEGVFRYVTGEYRDGMPDEERAKVIDEEPICAVNQLYTLDTQDALETGFAKKAVRNPEELYGELGLDPARVERLFLSRSERVLTLLDMFSPMLIAAGFVLLFIEISHPGFGLPGILGVSCFVGFFVIKWTLHYAHMLEVLLFVAGLVLLLIEVFLTPGFGVMGISGIVLMFVALVLAFQAFGVPQTSFQTGTLLLNLTKVVGSIAVSFVGIALLIRILPAMPGLRGLVLRTTLAKAQAGDLTEAHAPGLASMAGRSGVALTALRPAGRAAFGDLQLDVVTEGDFVGKGARVRILEVHGNRVVVAPDDGARRDA